MANYKRLAELIADNKGKLCHKLEGLTLPSNADEIKRLCIDYVEHLTRKDSEYMNQLSLLEQDLLSHDLKVALFSLFYYYLSYASVLVFHDIHAALRLADALSADVIACRFLSC